MMISTKGRYALRIMIDLAQHADDGYISLKGIAERQEISMKYLEMIVGLLSKNDLVLSQRGKDGGYKLAKDASEYSVGEILRAAEGSLAPVACLECEENECPRAGECLSLPVWEKLDELISWYFDNATLADVLTGNL